MWLFHKTFFNQKTCVRPNTECKLCGGLLDLDNWIHRLFRESQGRWGSFPAMGCKGGSREVWGVGMEGGLMWEGGGGLGWDYWIRRRGGWRFGRKKGVAPISSYSTLRFPGKLTLRLVARMRVIIKNDPPSYSSSLSVTVSSLENYKSKEEGMTGCCCRCCQTKSRTTTTTDGFIFWEL